MARAEDLLGNDWAAKSVVDSMCANIVGPGFKPQSRPMSKRLGITETQARDVSEQMEWVWTQWNTSEAHVTGKLTFDDLCYLGMRSTLGLGEMLHLPTMQTNDTARLFSLALQEVHPARLSTPSDMSMAPNMRDGIEMDGVGKPFFYWIADPAPLISGLDTGLGAVSANQYVRRPARIGHRPNVFHCFRAEENEQVRGVSSLAAGAKLYRHLNDALDYELIGQIIASSLTVFMETQDPTGALMNAMANADQNSNTFDRSYPQYQAMAPGTVIYGAPGERPHIIGSDKVGSNFSSFTELTLRAAAASIGMPYEVLSKDFSKTNYSSARAALLEAWRIFMIWRGWLINHYCRPVWALVQEEAFLRGYVRLPKRAPGFYEAKALWLNSKWIGPARGYVDPVKEINAQIKALDARLTTYADVIAERGEDRDEVWNTRAHEQEAITALYPAQEPVEPAHA